MTEFVVKPLDASTWPDCAALAERHGGVFGGGWWTCFHQCPDLPERKTLGDREFKRGLVEAGRTHAALVCDDAEAVAWAQFGPVADLPSIHHRKH